MKKKKGLKRKKKKEKKLEQLNTIPEGAILVNPAELSPNHSYRSPPVYYIDQEFICRDCGSNELWTATQQKWWYDAVRCRSCREKVKEEKERQKKHMEEMALKKPHPNEAFFKKGKR